MIDRQAPRANATSSSFTSRWVTRRTCVPVWVPPPRGRPDARWFRARASPPPPCRRTPCSLQPARDRSSRAWPRRCPPPASGRVRGPRAAAVGPSLSAMMPAAAIMPACRHAPPNRIDRRRASRIISAGPQINDPIGAPRPFDRQNMRVSTSFVHAVTSTPAAAAALNMRAPSRCTGTPASVATVRTFASSSTGITVPPAPPTVFSTESRSTISTS